VSAEALRLVPIFCGERSGLIEPLAAEVAEVFHLPVEVRRPSFDPELAFDADRGQYNSRILLAQLLRESPEPAVRLLGMTALDLFIPVLTHVFGEAQLDGRAAVVSAYRLDNRLYGLPANPHLLFERLAKEAVHELGHTYGLRHCLDGGCVMASSTYAEEIDWKAGRFCDRCLELLDERRAHRSSEVAHRT